MDNNTIEGFHVISMKDGVLKLNTGKMYRWNIPKSLRKEPIEQGDIVLVRTAQGKARVVVMQVFREEFEETGRSYKKVLKVIERAPKRELISEVGK